MTVSDDSLQLTHVPPVTQGMLIRRPASEVFQALIDPVVTTKFWFSKSSGKPVPGEQVTVSVTGAPGQGLTVEVSNPLPRNGLTMASGSSPCPGKD